MPSYPPFIDILFGEKPDNLFILIFTLPGKESFWFRTAAEATRHAAFLAATTQQNVYMMMSLSTADRGPHARGTEATAGGIAGVWLDVDYAGPGHLKPNLPPSFDEAQDLIDAMPLPPTMTVYSGGGLQAYWQFADLWLFADAADRERAKALTTAWNHLFIDISAQQSYTADSVGDLVRVLRVPGTINYKVPDQPATVEIIQYDPARRYSIEDLQSVLPAPVVAPKVPRDKTPSLLSDEQTRHGAIVINMQAGPPDEKWEALRINEPKAELAYLHKMRVGDKNDSSASAYDLALANHAVAAAWTDQEICDLLVAHRLYHNAEIKRAEYFSRTIEKARTTGQQKALQDFTTDLPATGDGEIAETPESRRAQLFASVSQTFGLQITRILKYMTDPPSYRIETERGAIALKHVDELINETRLRSNIAAAASVFIPVLKKTWPSVAQSLLDLCEEQDTGEEATSRGIVASWLHVYFQERKPTDDRDVAITTQQPFFHEQQLYFFGMDLRRWLQTTWQEKITPQDMAVLLKTYGCTPKTFPVSIGGKRVKLSAWWVPRETADVGR